MSFLFKQCFGIQNWSIAENLLSISHICDVEQARMGIDTLSHQRYDTFGGG